MNLQELRWGNYIYFDKKLITVSANNINDIIKFNYQMLIEPIPLTEEWLVKFEFELEEKRTYHKLINKDTEFCVYIDGEILELNSLIIWQSDAVYVRGILKYVHQLQNLYFALTGEELTIKN